MTEQQHRALVAKQVWHGRYDKNGKKAVVYAYASFPGWEAVEAFIESVELRDRVFYEVVLDEPALLYLDVELDRDDEVFEWPTESEFMDEFMSYLSKFLEERYGIEYETSSVSSAHKLGRKFSFHFTLPFSLTLAQRTVFKDQFLHFKRIYPAPFEFDKQSGVPDLKVYTHDRQWRMLGNTKFEQSRPLTSRVNVGDHDFFDGKFQDHVVSFVPAGTPVMPEPIFEIPQEQRARPRVSRPLTRQTTSGADEHGAKILEVLRDELSDSTSKIKSYEGCPLVFC
jgi:hypothetical protein